MNARVARAGARARGDGGFGMIELLAAMAVLMIGLFAIFAMFESSSRTIKRASTVSTASALADAQLEGFRAKLYADIGLVDSQVTAATAPYSSDPAYDADAADRVDLPACGSSPCTTSVPVQTLTGADGRSYRVDTYVTWQTVSNGTATGRDVKLVTIVVRDADDTTKVWTRVSSSFDESTGT